MQGLRHIPKVNALAACKSFLSRERLWLRVGCGTGFPKAARMTHLRVEEAAVESVMLFFRSAPRLAFLFRSAAPTPLCLHARLPVFGPFASRTFLKGA